jgi:predicted small secreted protein
MTAKLLACVLACFFFLSACEEEGTAEKAGKKIDETLEKASDAVEEATEDINKE